MATAQGDTCQARPWGSKWLESEAGLHEPLEDDANGSAEWRSQQASTSGRHSHGGTRWFNVVQGIRRSLDVHLKSYFKVDSVFASTLRFPSSSDKLRALVRGLTDTRLIDFCCICLVHPSLGTFGVVALSGAGSELYPPTLSEEAARCAAHNPSAGSASAHNVFTRCVFQVQDSNWAVEDVVASRAPWYYDCASATNGYGLPQEACWLRRAGMRSVLALPCMQQQGASGAGGDVTGVLLAATKQKTLDHLLLRKLEELCSKITPIVADAVSQHSQLLSNRRLAAPYESILDFAHAVLGEMLNLDRAVAVSVSTGGRGNCVTGANGAASGSQQRQHQRQASIAAAAASKGRSKGADGPVVFDAAAAVAAAAAAGFTWTAPVPAAAAAAAAASKCTPMGGCFARLKQHCRQDKASTAAQAVKAVAAAAALAAPQPQPCHHAHPQPSQAHQQQGSQSSASPLALMSQSLLQQTGTFQSALTGAPTEISSKLFTITGTTDLLSAPLPLPAEVPTAVCPASEQPQLQPQSQQYSHCSSPSPVAVAPPPRCVQSAHQLQGAPAAAVAAAVATASGTTSLPSRMGAAPEEVLEVLRSAAAPASAAAGGGEGDCPAAASGPARSGRSTRSTRSLSCLEFSGSIPPADDAQSGLCSGAAVGCGRSPPSGASPHLTHPPAGKANDCGSPRCLRTPRAQLARALQHGALPAASCHSAPSGGSGSGSASGSSARSRPDSDFMLETETTGDMQILPMGSFMLSQSQACGSRTASYGIQRGMPLEPSLGPSSASALASAHASSCGPSSSRPTGLMPLASLSLALRAGGSTCGTAASGTTIGNSTVATNALYGSNPTTASEQLSAAARLAVPAAATAGSCDPVAVSGGFLAEGTMGRWSRDSAAAAAAMWSNEASEAVAAAARFTAARTGALRSPCAQLAPFVAGRQAPSTTAALLGVLYGIEESGPLPSSGSHDGSGRTSAGAYVEEEDDCGIEIMDMAAATTATAAAFASGLAKQDQRPQVESALRMGSPAAKLAAAKERWLEFGAIRS